MSKNYRIFECVLLVALVTSCGLFHRGSSDEIVLAPTEVGTPVGNSVTAKIGATGGTLVSPDGRIILTVPPNAVAETVEFAIQPISNKASSGLGMAYRLEPSGKLFTTPVSVSFHYGDGDIEGTAPEALSLAYQDDKGAWHAQSSGKLDQAVKTLTVAMKHFTDVAALAQLRLTPTKATVRVGEGVAIQLQLCEQGFIDRILSRPVDCKNPPLANATWALEGPGHLQEAKLAAEFGMITVSYIAPAKRPTPNTATVNVSVTYHVWNQETGEAFTIQKNFAAKITIVNRGYRASGNDGSTSYSGGVCSLDQPFAIMANNTLVQYPINFTPSSGTAGEFNFSTSWGPLKLAGNGGYTVEGVDTEKPRIIAQPTSTLTGPPRSATGTGTAHIDLTPLDSGDCDN